MDPRGPPTRLRALTAGLLGLTRSLLSSGFFPAFSGRWRAEPSDLEEAEGGGGEKQVS